MKPMPINAKQVSPWRCDQCDHLMMMVRIPNDTPYERPLSSIGLMCIACDKTINLLTLLIRAVRNKAQDVH